MHCTFVEAYMFREPLHSPPARAGPKHDSNQLRHIYDKE